MRRFLFALVLLLAIYLVISRFTEVQEIVQTVQLGDWRWLGLGLLLQIAWLTNIALLYRSIYRLLGMDGTLAQLLLRPILRRPYLSEARAIEFASDAATGLAALRTDWREYLLPASLSLLGKAILIGILYMCCLAFQVATEPDTLVAGFCIAYLFTI